MINVIVAHDNKYGIGLENSIPWNLKTDLKYFADRTTHANKLNVVIMGRNTWESIPDTFKPLKNRINIIISTTLENVNDDLTFVFPSLNNALLYLDNDYPKSFNDIFIIGGERLYNEALCHPNIDKLYITEVYGDFKCDKHFPNIHKLDINGNPLYNFDLISVSQFYNEDNLYFRFFVYQKDAHVTDIWKNKEEQQYIAMLDHILEEGVDRIDRTQVGTLSTFGKQFTYDISETIPLLTTKRIFVRAVFEELALYISGKTDNGILQNKNIHIWDGNTTRDFLDKRGLTHYPENDMGETYGFNFRHYGAEYKTCSENYDGQGFDQLNYVVDQIKNNPTSRRIIINLWNAATMHKAALPACLCMYQFYVDTNKNKLNLQIYIRSSDFFLANNWNTCTGAFLVYMICNLKDINLTPGKLSVITGDTHIYKSHVDAVRENLKRTPKPYPMLKFDEEKTKLEDYCWDDFKIIGYKPYPNISAPMAV